jgi:hypothetical protein
MAGSAKYAGLTREGGPVYHHQIRSTQMAKKKIRYFITQDKDGNQLPHNHWSRALNAIIAKAHPAGLYITTKPEVVDLLLTQGYVEVDATMCDTLRIEDRSPDRIDYTITENQVKFSLLAA